MKDWGKCLSVMLPKSSVNKNNELIIVWLCEAFISGLKVEKLDRGVERTLEI